MDSLPNGTISGESRYGYTNNSAAANIISIGNVNSNGEHYDDDDTFTSENCNLFPILTREYLQITNSRKQH